MATEHQMTLVMRGLQYSFSRSALQCKKLSDFYDPQGHSASKGGHFLIYYFSSEMLKYVLLRQLLELFTTH